MLLLERYEPERKRKVHTLRFEEEGGKMMIYRHTEMQPIDPFVHIHWKRLIEATCIAFVCVFLCVEADFLALRNVIGTEMPSKWENAESPLPVPRRKHPPVSVYVGRLPVSNETKKQKNRMF